jgi:hypothetical protein
VSLDVEAFRANGYAVIRGAVPAALCEALVVAIGEVSGLDAWIREPILEDGEPSWSPQVDGYEVVEVPAGQDDLIVWESRMPHANSRNTSDRPRLACYVSMNPATPDERRMTAECARSGA